MNLINDVIYFNFFYGKFVVYCASNFFDGQDHKFVIFGIKNSNGQSIENDEFLDLRDEIKFQIKRNIALHEHVNEMLKIQINKNNG